MRGICIDTGSSTVLQEGKEYYLFEHGPNYYVSKFNNAKSHFGSFRKSLFKLVEEKIEQPQEIIFKDRNDPQRYVGEVVSKYKGYGFEIGERYVLGVIKYPGVYRPGTPATSFYMYAIDDLRFRGCMPSHMFKIIGPYEPSDEPKEVANTKTLDEPIKAESEPENEQKPAQYEQTSIFDFLEG